MCVYINNLFLPSLFFLFRMLVAYPQTKTYFTHWGAAELVPGSSNVKKHGATIMGAVGKAVKGIDDLSGTLSALSDLHAFQLRVDPANFKVTEKRDRVVSRLLIIRNNILPLCISLNQMLMHVNFKHILQKYSNKN